MNERAAVQGQLPEDLGVALRRHASTRPNQLALSFLTNGIDAGARLTYGELHRKACRIAAQLQQAGAAGERGLMLYSAPSDFVPAFLGCLYSGCVAVPAPPPDFARLKRALPRLTSIAKDADVRFLLTTESLRDACRKHDVDFAGHRARWIETDSDQLPDHDAYAWQEPAPDSLAYLQYTSGSTRTPAGVMVSHGNLAVNCLQMAHSGAFSDDSVSVSWLPYFHDLGLVSAMALPIWRGIPAYLMSPVSFLKRPLEWLAALSAFQGTHTAAPNFAYEHCVARYTPEHCHGLDLRRWEVAANAAEPVRAETLERFSATFGRYGFAVDRFKACYGLAEATLNATGANDWQPPIVLSLSASALEEHRVEECPPESKRAEPIRKVVDCGPAAVGSRILIVDPTTCMPCAEGRIGEIWLQGPNVALGYWGRPDETEATFQGRLADSDDGPFLRTGDLGFLHRDRLFVTGRIKDLIIIGGVNHYPHDIEWTVEQCHPDLRRTGSAAFSLDTHQGEALGVVAEVERLVTEVEPIIEAIRQAVSEHHQIEVARIALIRRGSLLKTSSGKVQRNAVRQQVLSDQLEAVHHYHRGTSSEDRTDHSASAPDRIDQLRKGLRERIGRRLQRSPESLDLHAPLSSLGVGSIDAVGLVGEIEEWLGGSYSPSLLFECPTLDALAVRLAGSPGPVADPALAATPSAPPTSNEAIAVVGMACRFPGAESPAEFWELLCEGRDAVTEVPRERWPVDTYYGPEPQSPGRMNTRWGGFLQDIDRFDADVFGISPREAAQIDPQQRLTLDAAYEALESAGMPPSTLAGSQTGVFVGICVSDYGWLQLLDPAQATAYAGTGSALSIAANRVSYTFDFRGPSLAVDTACSSSLASVHLACESLRSGESTLALAGGVNLTLSPHGTVIFSQALMMSPTGRCKTFDASADGYVRGEGCGMVVLKPLSAALRDGDPVLAVIRGSAMNQDGRSNGITAPNPASQRQVIRRALANAGIERGRVQYVETHGTGTPLGDFMEVEALAEELGRSDTSEPPCLIGSVKTNIGHLEAAAGIAGLVKVVLMLRHGKIPPHLHLSERNPRLPMSESGLDIATESRPWPSGATPRCGAVSSFGFGGTNVHVILEEAQPGERRIAGAERTHHVLCLSAYSESALCELAGRYRDALPEIDAQNLADVAYTANTGRESYPHRLAIVFKDAPELREALNEAAEGRNTSGSWRVDCAEPARSGVAFFFPSLRDMDLPAGTPGLGDHRVVRSTREECATCSPSFPAAGVAQLAVARLWQSWGVEPTGGVAAQGAANTVAALLSGSMSLDQAGSLASALPMEGGKDSDVLSSLAGFRTNGCRIVIEIGPPSDDSATFRQAWCREGGLWLHSMNPNRGAWQHILGELACLYVHGVEVDWVAFDSGFHRRKVDLPSYPFQRKRHWSLPDPETYPCLNRDSERTGHPWLGDRIRMPLDVAVFENRIRADRPAYLTDHDVGGVLFPAAGYLAMGLAAVYELNVSPGCEIRDLNFVEALRMESSGVTVLQTLVDSPEEGIRRFRIVSRVESDRDAEPSWRLHARGNIAGLSDLKRDEDMVSIDDVRRRCNEPEDVDGFYETLARAGVRYGPHFRGIVSLHVGREEALAKAYLAGVDSDPQGTHDIWPPTIDAGLQTLARLAPDFGQATGSAWLPIGIRRTVICARFPSSFWCHAVGREESVPDGQPEGDVFFYDSEGRLLARLEGVRAARVSIRPSTASGEVPPDWLYQVRWLPDPRRSGPSDDTRPVSLQEVERRMRNAVPGLRGEFNVPVYEGLIPAVEAVSADYIARALHRLGWTPEPGQRVSSATLQAQLRIADRHRPLFVRMLEVLQEVGILAPEDEAWIVRERLEVGDPNERTAQLMAQYPECRDVLILLEACGPQLPDVLVGRKDPLEVLFPGGSSEFVEPLYRNSPFARMLNALVVEAINAGWDRQFAHHRPRILEIGGGTGGTTEVILSSLPAGRFSFLFSDISPLFVARAQQEFGARSDMQYAILDIERDPIDQGFSAHQFDVVVAANVVHATVDLRVTLSHVRSLLAPGGLLILVEGQGRQRSLDITLGMMEGWWRFRDHDIRPSYPLLPAAAWEEILREAGFSALVVAPNGERLDGSPAPLQQAVMVTRSVDRSEDDRVDEGTDGWIVLTHGGGIGDRLAEALRAQGSTCIVAEPGQSFRRAGPDSYTVDPTRRDDIAQCFDTALSRENVAWRGVLHLWGVDSDGRSGSAGFDIRRAQQVGCGSLLSVVQEWCTRIPDRPAGLWVVTSGARFVGEGDELPGVAQSSLWGLARVIELEHPEIRCRRVDLDPRSTVEDAAANVLQELHSSTRGSEGDDDEVAWREGTRFVARLAPSGPVNHRAPTFEPDATYLITGGSGGLGLAVASWMVDAGARHLALVARSRPSAHADAVVRGLEQAGATCRVIEADLSQPSRVESMLQELSAALPPVRGIIHAAGILDDAAIVHQTWERFERVLGPKMYGAWALHEATRDMHLDFFVLFSSMASIIGSPAQSNHAAANAFLDELAAHRRAQGLVGTSINWGVWSDVGSAAGSEVRARARDRGLGTLLPEQGLAVLAHVLESNPVQVCATPVTWRQFAQNFSPDRIPGLFRDVIERTQTTEGPKPAGLKWVRELSAALPAERLPMLQQRLRREAARVLGISDVESLRLDHSLLESGMDSLMALDLRRHVESALGLTLPGTLLFEYPAIDTLARHLLDSMELPSVPQSVASSTPNPTPSEDDESAELSAEEAEALIDRELEWLA